MNSRQRTGRQARRRFFASLVAVATTSAVLSTTAGAQTPPSTTPGLQPRAAASKAAITVDPASRRITLKFREGSGVRLRGGTFVTGVAGVDLAGTNGVLAAYPGTVVERLFERSEADLAQDEARVESRSGRDQADLNLYYRVIAPQGADVRAVIAAFNAQAVVEYAASEPKAAAPPVTPDFTPQQGYRDPAPGGIDATYASTLPGGKGQNVLIADIEYSWNVNHEDLSKARAAGAVIANGTPSDPFNDNDHGTAVLGEIVADENGFGVTGILSGAGLRLVNANNTGGYALANAINLAAAALTAGDVILIEQQTSGPNGGCDSVSQVGCAPVEWEQAFYDAIVLATSAGITVVEAAGNGTQDLDSAAYNPMTSRADSGAIIVGSANAPGCTDPARGRRPSSNFGARVNVQGWGQCVVSTGYGDLQGGADPNVHYTNSFSGTSSASPIVAGAAGVLSSVAQQRGTSLTPQQIRQILRDTGTPQEFGLAGAIGPQPNLHAALAVFTCATPPPATITALPGVLTVGTTGDDVIYGTAGPDRILGMGGNDTILGLGGDDQLFGGEGNDLLCGGPGNDRLAGDNGNDILQGDAGNDDLAGGAGNDSLFGNGDVDRLDGGQGTDQCTAGGQAGDATRPTPFCETVI
ncbi:MAG TPA: S8 family serine peptidase [Acidimicrobiales bacterium]|nr:S8 family serine peptidase [Acidimicrobiales bacterium]